MSKDLAGLFNPPNSGSNLEQVTSGVCTAWDAVTHHSTVVVGGVVTYTNLPISTSALATMATGLVWLVRTDRGPIIVGGLTVPT